MDIKPNIGVNVAIIQDNRILLTRREDFEIWCLPGGAIDHGESIAGAARREIREEIGLEIELDHLTGIYSEIKGDYPTLHIVLITAHPTSAELRLDPSEVVEARYFSPNELPVDIMVGHLQRIQDAFSATGGALAWCQKSEWPFDPGLSRQQIYALRDESGLSRRDFYAKSTAGAHYEQILEVS